MRTLVTFLTAALLWCGSAAAALACPTATSVQADAIFANSISVHYTPASGIGQYVVQLFQGSTRVATQYTPWGGVSFHLLQPATTYSVRVGSVCSPGDTTFAATVSVTTPGGSAPCPPVTNVTLGQVTGTQATVSFAAASGATNYTIWYWSLADTTTRYTMTVAGPPAVLTNLLPNTAYQVWIFTNCSAGNGTVIGPRVIIQTTGGSACSAASNVVVTATGSTTAAVSFTPGGGTSGYQVVYYAAGDPTLHYVNGASSPITLTGLTTGKTYYIQLQSKCSGSSSTTVYTASGYAPYSFRGTSTLTVRNQLGAGTVEAYPNPAHLAVTVQLPGVAGAGSARLTLLNALGQPVRTSEIPLTGDATRAEVPLSGLVPGLYTLLVAADGQVATQRLAVE